ncbi:MAG TPA: hypothetical protein VGI70_08500 [Polyangiales bacterium]|jgi:hypothetical protein
MRTHARPISALEPTRVVVAATLVGWLAIEWLAASSAVHAQATLLAGTASPLIEVSAVAAPRAEPICQTEIRVSGTLYDATNPAHSFAMLQLDGADPRGAVYRVGSLIGAFVLIAVEPRGIRLRDERGDCWLRLVGASAPRSNRAAPTRLRSPARRAPTRASAFSAAELEHGIRTVAANGFEVERALLTKAVARAAQIMQTMRLQQEFRHGEASGLIVQRIPEAGLMHHLGLRRGDVLRAFNGLPLTSLDGLLRAQNQLANAPRLSLLLMRDGRPTTLDYRLVD